MAERQDSRHTFNEGDYALLIDRRGRRYLVQLDSSETFSSHLGEVPHATLIGTESGSRVTTVQGHRLLALKPTMADFTLKMPRTATVVYPKDLGAILVHGDIFPGARVLEAGTGSGAVTIALLRAVGKEGRVTSYDIRQDMIERARANVEAMCPRRENLTIKMGDVYEGFEERDLDRIVLDLPEPWHVVPHAADTLVPGGIMLSFLPTVLQVRDLTESLRRDGGLDVIETIEIFMRRWQVGGRSVRPDHRMIGHTGFITTARKCAPLPSRPPTEEIDESPAAAEQQRGESSAIGEQVDGRD